MTADPGTAQGAAAEVATEARDLFELVAGLSLQKVLVTLGVMVVGFLVARLAARLVTRLSRGRLSTLQALLLSRTAYLLALLVAVSIALSLWGQSLTVLFGAAGILTLALGFASQTSASNLISGFFLMAERSFSVGDLVRVDGYFGEVVSIDLLSVKLRTFDNVLVRIPNENLIKTDVETVTRYPIRRVDLMLPFHQSVDLDRVEARLRSALADETRALVEPSPDFVVDSFVDGVVMVRFSVWSAQANVLAVRTGATKRLLATLRDLDVELAGPRRLIDLAEGRYASPRADAPDRRGEP